MATPTYTALATTEITASISDVTFSSIPTYRDYIVVFSGECSAELDVAFTLNGDTGANYHRVFMSGPVLSVSGANQTAGFWGIVFGTPNNLVAHLMDAGASDKHTTALVRSDAMTDRTRAYAGRWADTAVVNSIKIGTTGTFDSGRISLYGIEA